MTEFRVCWEIDVEAETPEAAAREALRIQRKADSIATVFMVQRKPKRKDGHYGLPQKVDLTEIDGSEI